MCTNKERENDEKEERMQWEKAVIYETWKLGVSHYKGDKPGGIERWRQATAEEANKFDWWSHTAKQQYIWKSRSRR